MKKVAILQSSYIPWKGYFDLIGLVDEFVILDSVQYTKNDWRNRNRIKTANSLLWLTIPVLSKGKSKQLIKDVELSGHKWQYKHWKSIEFSYRKSKYFDEVSNFLKPLYLDNEFKSLSDLNTKFIVEISDYLNLNTKINNSSNFFASKDKNQRLIDILKKLNADIYFSGPSARSYINEEEFKQNDIKIFWMNYSDYPIYDQLWGAFVHEVSIIDLLFNCGKNSIKYMKVGSLF